MVYGLKNSRARVIHTADCRHIARCAGSRLNSYADVTEALRDGRHFCRHCNPVLQEFARQRASFDAFCVENGFRYRVGRMSIDLRSSAGDWKLAVGADNLPVLFHKNEEWRTSDLFSPISGYHLQRCPETQLLGQLSYIRAHDGFRTEHPFVSGCRQPKAKGKKKRKKQQTMTKQQARRAAIRRVLDTIDALQRAAG